MTFMYNSDANNSVTRITEINQFLFCVNLSLPSWIGSISLRVRFDRQHISDCATIEKIIVFAPSITEQLSVIELLLTSFARLG